MKEDRKKFYFLTIVESVGQLIGGPCSYNVVTTDWVLTFLRIREHSARQTFLAARFDISEEEYNHFVTVSSFGKRDGGYYVVSK